MENLNESSDYSNFSFSSESVSEQSDGLSWPDYSDFSSSSESVSEQSDGLSWPSHSSLTSLADDENRTDYLLRQGLSAVLECEDQLNQGLIYQENPEYAPQMDRLNRETRHHMQMVDTYFIECAAEVLRNFFDSPSVERAVGVKQLEKSLDWLEKINPELGQNYRQKLLSNHKNQFMIDKLESEKADLEALIENQETNLTSSESNQRSQYRQGSSLDGITLVVSGKVDWHWESIGIKFGPEIHLKGGGSSSFHFGFAFNFDQLNTNRESGVVVALSANKQHLETGVESRFSKEGSEHAFTAQVKSSSDLSAGVEIRSHSFREFSSNVISGGRFIVGCKLDTNPVEGEVRLCVLPFETFKKWLSSNFDKTELDLSSLPSTEENLEFVFRQKDFEATYSVVEVEKETIERSEKAENLENQYKEVATFDQARVLRRSNQVSLFAPSPELPPGCAHTSPPLFNYLAFGLLSLGGVAGIVTLVYKFITRNKD